MQVIVGKRQSLTRRWNDLVEYLRQPFKRTKDNLQHNRWDHTVIPSEKFCVPGESDVIACSYTLRFACAHYKRTARLLQIEPITILLGKFGSEWARLIDEPSKPLQTKKQCDTKNFTSPNQGHPTRIYM